MTRRLLAALLAVCLLAACESLSRDPPEKRQPPDQGCLNDCLGTGGERGFCTDRCTR